MASKVAHYMRLHNVELSSRMDFIRERALTDLNSDINEFFGGLGDTFRSLRQERP